MKRFTFESWSAHEPEWMVEGRAIRLVVDGSHYFFENQSMEPIQALATQAVDFTKSHFGSLVASRADELGLSEHALEMLAIVVGLRFLSLFNSFKNSSAQYREHDLRLSLREMQHDYTRDEVLSFSQRYFPANYRLVSSLLVGMSETEFAVWESNRRAFWESR